MAGQPRVLTWSIPASEEGSTIKHLLKTHFHMAEGYIASLKLREDGILLDGVRARTNTSVREGMRLSVRVDDVGRANPARPVLLPVSVVYEDLDLAVLEKPAGILIHGPEGGEPTLANVMAAHWGSEQPFHPVHRLDRGTSGLLLAAKSAYVSELLRRQMHTEDTVREYLALAEGWIRPEKGSIRLPIGVAEGERLRRCVRPDGQSARTDYEALARFRDGCLLRLRLYTGRTHQIRVHLAAVGHPLYGDVFYGGASCELSRPALHSAYLRLRHPVTGEVLDFHSPLPDELQAFMDTRQ